MIKIKRIGLKNFRAYSGGAPHWMDIGDFTAIVGKNDSGKSTWLEALAIFFEDKSCKPTADDLSVGTDDETFSIYASFDIEDEIVIDASNKVSLEDEFLKDALGMFTVKKEYKNGKNTGIFIHANHPTAELSADLLTLKIDELKERAKTKLGITDEVARSAGALSKAATWRRVIRDKCGDLKLSECDLQVDEEGTKKVWGAIAKQLPTYGLFKVDRDNSDQDGEAQDPFKFAIKNVLAKPEVRNAIDSLKELVKDSYTDIATATLNELRSINKEIAEELVPNFGDPKLESAFKPNIETENHIPLNKRGSGVRRLVLISFFCAEAKRNTSGENGTIYAIEEPETSQHPAHQQILVEALTRLSANNGQVLITTHSPQLLRDVKVTNVRYIKREEGVRKIETGDDTLVDVVTDLGQLPIINSGCLVCIEGTNDIAFLRNISKIPELKAICNLDEYSILPLGGGRLEQWVSQHPLNFAQIHEFHLYDSDADEKYKKATKTINSKWDNCFATLTSAREAENYIHPDLVNQEFGTDLSYDDNWHQSDIPLLISQKTGKDEKQIKKILNGKIARHISKQTLGKMGLYSEVESWFKRIKELSR